MGDPLVHTVPAGKQLPEPQLPEPFIAGVGWGQGTGQWEQGRALGESSGRFPDVCILRCGPAWTPAPLPGPWDAALWEPGRSSDPVPGPPVLALCPHCPRAQGPPWGLPVCAPCHDPSLLPEALGPFPGTPQLPREASPTPPLQCSPQPWPLDSSLGFSRWGRRALVPAVGLPPQHQDMVDGAALDPLSSGSSSGRFCSGPVT